MKKKINSYQFRNIIKEKIFNKYNQREKERFLIDKKIYIPHKNELNNPFWLYDFDYSNDYEISDGFIDFTDMNVLFIKEMLRYCEEYGGLRDNNHGEYVKRLKRNINMTLDDLDKERVIRGEYEKYSRDLNSSHLTDYYFDENIEVDDMFGCITLEGIDETTVFKYITKEYPYLGDDSPISDCIQINKSIKILKFLKKEMAKIKTPYEQNIYKSEFTIHFNDGIFRTIEAQNWFYETLYKMGAIEDHNKPKRRKFQPICSAIFYSISCKKHILKYGLKLEDLINFLNKEFKTKIKTKLSVGHLHESEVSKNIEKFIENNNLA